MCICWWGVTHKRRHDRTNLEYPGPVDVADEILDVGVTRVQQYMLWFILLDDITILEDHQPVSELECFIQVMGNEDNGLVQIILQLQQEILHVSTNERIKCRECLVHQHDG